MQLHQVVVTASPNDAVTTAALEFRTLLRQFCDSEIFALNIDPDLQHEVRSIRGMPQPAARDRDRALLLFHASIGSPEVFAFLVQRPERIVMMYHNISPAAAFAPYEPAFADLLAAGRNELKELRNRTVLALAPSRYNAAELLELGYSDVRFSPLIVDVARLRRLDPMPAAEEYLRDTIKGTVFLFVGQQLPHKRPDFLLQAFHILTTHLLADCHLMVVGAARLHHYGNLLDKFRRELNLSNVALLGSLPEEELAAHFRRADVFVTASEHEGFCVPLLEAMAFEIPVIARACAAIPETVRDAGVLIPATEGPAMLAEGMAMLATDAVLRQRCIERGLTRVADFDADLAKSTFLQHLMTVV